MSDDPYLSMPAPETSEGVSLPYPALYLSWENGQPQLRELGGLACFGGWSAKQEQADEIDGLKLPRGFAKYNRNFKSGDSKPCYGSRLITVSIFAMRWRWVNRQDDRNGSMSYRPGDVKHVQWLAALFTDPALTAFTPAVLTTKGVQVKRIEAAQKEWREAINARNAKFARYPISAFAITLGSSGDKPVYESVGDKEKYTITPIKALIPEDPDKRLIPPAVVTELTELRKRSNDWLVAWTARYGSADDKAFASANVAPPAAEDIPF